MTIDNINFKECFNKTVPTNKYDVLKTEARWNGIYKIIRLLVILLVIVIIVAIVFLFLYFYVSHHQNNTSMHPDYTSPPAQCQNSPDC